MGVAWLAPGQGSERPGMGRDLAAWPVAADLLRGLEPGLHDTALVQPALVAVALATAAVLREHAVPCDLVAGHSVGELAAWALAGGADPADAVALARARGHAMSAAARACPGELWALAPGVPIPDGWRVAVENPDQTVVAGEGAPPSGARRVPTGGAWHTPAMGSAVTPFRAALSALPSQPLARPLVSGRDGAPVRDDADAREALVGQLTAPCRWSAVIATLARRGVTDVVILGPGKVLAAQLGGAAPGVRVHRTDRAVDLAAALARLGGVSPPTAP